MPECSRQPVVAQALPSRYAPRFAARPTCLAARPTTVMITPMALIGIQRESGMLSPNEVFLAQMITKGPRAMNAVQATARRTLDSPLNPFQPLSDLPHTFSFASPLYTGLGVLRLPLVGACSSYGTACLSFCGMLSSQSLRVRSSLDSSLPHCPFLRLVKVGQREGKRDSRQKSSAPDGE